jgi:hypothetical protein
MTTFRPAIASRRKVFRHLAVAQSLVAGVIVCQRAQSLTIVPTFDSTITANPQAATIQATINSAIAFYETNFSDPVSVTIAFYAMTNGLGRNGPFSDRFSYTSYRAALASHVTSADDAIAVAHLPNTTLNPVDGNPYVDVILPLARALGLTSDTGSPYDDQIGLNVSICNLSAAQNDPTKFSLFAVTCHEIDEALGVSSALDGFTNGAVVPSIPIEAEDLFRYDETGARSFDTSLSTRAYFSLAGTTDLAQFNQNQGGDYNDWIGGINPPQVQDAVGTPGATPVPVVELRVLDALGYTRMPATVWVDFTYSGSTQNGAYTTPFIRLAQATNAVSPGAVVAIKGPNIDASSGPAVSHETLAISKAMKIVSVEGPATIGR